MNHFSPQLSNESDVQNLYVSSLLAFNSEMNSVLYNLFVRDHLIVYLNFSNINQIQCKKLTSSCMTRIRCLETIKIC